MALCASSAGRNSDVLLSAVVAKACSCVGPQNITGRPARCLRRLMQVPMLSAHGISIGCKPCVIVYYDSRGWMHLWFIECTSLSRRLNKCVLHFYVKYFHKVVYYHKIRCVL